MGKKKQPSADSFIAQLTQALDNFTKPAKLGKSPLADPYFLGDHLLKQRQEEIEQPIGRGKALRSLLREAVNDFSKLDENLIEPHEREDTGKDRAYYQRLLELKYFQAKSWKYIETELGFSRAQLSRHRDQAIRLLEKILIPLLRPALLLESPLRPSQLVGREENMRSGLVALQQRRRIGLVGPAGIGKTVLAAQLLATQKSRPVFWFTFRLGINDQLSGLLFPLAYFLYRCGVPEMWLQLVADQGKINMAVIPGLLLNDLKRLGESSPIFCFDEVDILRDGEVQAHSDVLNFLRLFPETTSVMLIGQRIPIEASEYIELSELSLSHIRDLMLQNNVDLSLEHLSLLHDYTKGNPRLLTLYITLHETGETLPDVLSSLRSAPSLDALVKRILPKLKEQERVLLTKLAVYPHPVSRTIWPDEQDQLSLKKLVRWRLVQSDIQGSVSVLHAYREAICNDLPPEVRIAHHLAAAAVRAGLRAYTDAAYHCVEAQQPDLAVRLWYPHQTSEINQGQAETALRIFSKIARDQLKEQDDQKCLDLIRCELRKLMSDYDRLREDLASMLWKPDIWKIRADRIRGDVAEVAGELQIAAIAYQEGLATVENLLEKEAILFHRGLGWVYRLQELKSSYEHEDSFDSAWRETLLAHYEIANLQGNIQRDRGLFAEAKTVYLNALSQAKALGHTQGEAKTSNVLANLLAQQGEFREATLYWENAYNIYKRIGKHSGCASVRVNQATGHTLSGEPDKAILLGEEALKLFELFDQPYGKAVGAHTLAEAYLAKGDLVSAENFARRALAEEVSRIVPDVLRVIGEIKLMQEDYGSAEKYIKQAIDAAKGENSDKRKFPYLEAYAWRALGQVFLKVNNYSEARSALEKAINIFEMLELSKEVAKTREIQLNIPPVH